MKRALFALALLVSGCGDLTPTKQQQAEITVKNYLDSTLNDPRSYEPVSFEQLTPVKASDDTTRLIGYLLPHTYRAKNGFGALTIQRTIFQVDTALTKVIDTYPGDK